MPSTINFLVLLLLISVGLSSIIIPREGGLSAVGLDQVIKYVRWLQNQPSVAWKHSIQALSSLIDNNPVLRFNWEFGIALSNFTLPNRNGSYVLDLINKALVTPPNFINSPLIGFPINSILIQFMQTQSGENFFSQKSVNDVFHEILDQYQKMITSPVSAKYLNDQEPYGWFSSEACKQVNYFEYQGGTSNSPVKNYANWNQWFLRKFKNIQVTRPINAGAPQGVKDEDIIVNACESTPLTNPMQPVLNTQSRDTFWLKDTPYSLKDMFGDAKIAAHFNGGTVYQAFLSSMNYHRWHAPVSGTIERIYNIPGTYFYGHSKISTNFDSSSAERSQAFISSVAARQVFVIKADNPKIGSIALIFIGMAQASSCVATVKQGCHVQKGDEIGHFQFGGSSHTMIFEKGIHLQFNQLSNLYSGKGQSLSGVKQNLRSYLAHVFMPS